MSKLVIPEKHGQLKALASGVAERVSKYFQDPQHRKEFEAWYLERYGKPYKWTRMEEVGTGKVQGNRR